MRKKREMAIDEKRKKNQRYHRENEYRTKGMYFKNVLIHFITPKNKKNPVTVLS